MQHEVTVTVKCHELFISLSSLCPGEDPFYHSLGVFDPPGPLYSSTEYQPLALDNSGVLFSDRSGDVINEHAEDLDSSADWEFSFPVLESIDYSGEGAGCCLFFCFFFKKKEKKLSKALCSCLTITHTHKKKITDFFLFFLQQRHMKQHKSLTP